MRCCFGLGCRGDRSNQRGGKATSGGERCGILEPNHTKESRLEAAQCPPPGYDSVIGETGGTGPDALNYDECVVYTSEQAIPTYLIVYSLAELPEEEQDDD